MAPPAGQRECNDDVRLLQATGGLLARFTQLLQKALWREDSEGLVMRRSVLTAYIDRLVIVIEPFQEDPQLLDQDLKQILPSLIRVLASAVELGDSTVPEGYSSPRNAVCRILYSLCKIRGENVIVRFLYNEPHYIEPILAIFESYAWGRDSTSQRGQVLPWHESYIFMLWLSHLMLTPFDLTTISSEDPSVQIRSVDLVLPQGLSLVVHRIAPLAFSFLARPGKDRDVAARVLARLCLRPDMREAGLLSAVVEWILDFLSKPSADSITIHRHIGALTVLKVLAASATLDEIKPYLFDIFDRSQAILEDKEPGSSGNSALGLRLCVKITRHLAVHCVRAGQSLDSVRATALVETTIESLLGILASGDSLVRFATSKALSHITLTLDADMASEVIDAIVAAYDENVFLEDGVANTTAVDPLQWHGITLTLAHLLYRRAPPPEKLLEILNALLLALNFEQRSASGTSVGGNVRDAACFGIWSISRRYHTKELQTLDPLSVRCPSGNGAPPGSSVIQTLACELVVVACLDPVGNIRRGSSAALQELIGRHQNTVHEGISLVQAVDYHAVGLHARAVVEVSKLASSLGRVYWQSLSLALLDWRGLLSYDEKIRSVAATALGGLLEGKFAQEVSTVLESIHKQLQELQKRQIEERHGLLMAAATILELPSFSAIGPDSALSWLERYGIFLQELNLQPADFTSTVLRPHLTAVSVISIVHSIASALLIVRSKCDGHSLAAHSSLLSIMVDLFNAVLLRPEPSINNLIPDTCQRLSQCLSPTQRSDQMDGWILQAGNVSGMKATPYFLSIGSLFTYDKTERPTKEQEKAILNLLLSRSLPTHEIEVRVIALQSLYWTFDYVMGAANGSDMFNTQKRLLEVIHHCLNDYTVNERGDVGSLVRFEALRLLQYLWASDSDILTKFAHAEGSQVFEGSLVCDLLADNVRLSVERLDKGRIRANECLSDGAALCSIPLVRQIGMGYKCTMSEMSTASVALVMTPEYFSTALRAISPEYPRSVQLAVIEGICGSTGLGTDDLIKASRQGVIATLQKEEVLLSNGQPMDTRRWFMALLVECIRNQRYKRTGDSMYKWNDRSAIPLFTLLSFVMEMGLHPNLPLQPHAATDGVSPGLTSDDVSSFPVPKVTSLSELVTLTYTLHYKSQAIQKLDTSIDVYRSLALSWVQSLEWESSNNGTGISSTPAHLRLATLLAHPFPRIRTLASQALWTADQVVEERPEAERDDNGSNGSAQARRVLLYTDWMARLDDQAVPIRNREQSIGVASLTVREAAKMVRDGMAKSNSV